MECTEESNLQLEWVKLTWTATGVRLGLHSYMFASFSALTLVASLENIETFVYTLQCITHD